MNSGVYGIRNMKNGKWYIGSSLNLNKRRASHFGGLKGQYNSNPLLQADYIKYGKNKFEFHVFEYVGEKDLYERELFWIFTHKANQKDHGYNMRISRRCNHPRKTTFADLNKYLTMSHNKKL